MDKAESIPETVVSSSLDPTSVAIIVAVLVVLTTIIFFLLKKSGTKGDTVLICGLSDSGKTHLYAKLANKDAEVVTYTSFKENTFDWKVGNNVLKVVDYPGAERLRKNLVEKFLKKDRSSIRKIVFVVDSATFGKRARDVAEFLYDIALESGKKIPLLVSCNKQDVSIAKSSEAIRSSLEREMGLINKSRAAALTSTDGSAVRNTLTDTHDEFKWEDLPNEIDFVECSTVVNSNVGLDSVRQWIKK